MPSRNRPHPRRNLNEADVLILPGTGFGEHWGDYMRMTLLQPIEVLAEVVERLKAVIARHAE
jgi:aspartate/methionine/tyrosine aminotransferase